MDEPRKPTEREQQHKTFCVTCITKIAAAANVELTKATIAVYLERLCVLDRAQLADATNRTITEWSEASKMPPLKFILDRCSSNPKLLAEQAWELAWKLVQRDWYADGIGWVAGAKEKLTPAMQYAIRQCGGEYRMTHADEEAFPFIRRDFLQAHERYLVEGGDQTRLTQAEAQNILGKLKRGELPE